MYAMFFYKHCKYTDRLQAYPTGNRNTMIFIYLYIRCLNKYVYI